MILNSADQPMNINTGLVVNKSIETSSGFEYISGLRKFGDLVIEEGVAQGTGVSFLSYVRIQNQEGDLLIDHPVNNGVKYSRERVRQIVLKELLGMLKEASLKNGKVFDESMARSLVDSKLKHAYYEKSYKAVLDWANSIGIELI